MVGSKQQQHGITLISFAIILGVVGFFAFTVMRLFPIYSEYYSVTQAMKAVQQEPGVASWEIRRLRDALDRRFNISYVENVKANQATLVREHGEKTLRIAYEVRKPFAYNLDVVANFDYSVDLTRPSVD